MRDDPRYLPTREEILERAKTLRLMRDNKFSTEFMDSCLLHNAPTVETVQRLCAKYGTMNAYAMMYLFTFDTFDKEPPMTDEALDKQAQIELAMQQQKEEAEAERIAAEEEYREWMDDDHVSDDCVTADC